MEEPRLDLDVNCAGTLALLDVMRSESPAAKLVVPGSRLQYGRAGTLPVGEDHPLEPLCIHGVHKAAVEQYLHVYRHAYGLRFTAFRLTNPYGPGQPRERVAFGIINRLVHLAIAGQTLTVFGDGKQLRDYVFIDDVVNGLLVAGANEATDGKVYNLGSGVGTPLVDVARGICEAAGSGTVAFAPWPPLTAQIETGDFVADVTRFVTETGWRPCVDLRHGLRRTVDAYRAG
jgi:UDP-glucose 4-epimerase